MLEEEEEEELPGTVSCPGAVLGLAAQPGSNEVRLTWTPAEARGADDDDPGVADPEWFGVVVRQGGDTRMVRVDAPTTGTVITGLRNRVEASFEVYAVTEDGSSEPAGPITATPITGMEGEVAGLIVAFEPGVEVSETDQSVPGESRVDSVDLSIAGKVTDDAVLVELSDAVSLAEAEQIAAELQGDPAVAWAEPDQFIFTASTQPQGPLAETVSVPDDARYATDQWNLWDQFGIGIGDGSTSMTDAWAQGTGEGATVAVIDTGITAHPDLDSQLVTGFDFVSNPEQLAAARTEGGEPVAFDADATNPSAFGDAGWDANPTDPGDWRGVAPTPDSSWHGTKVAGVIAAQARNSEGIAGIAPGAKIQPIRALSWRGGLLSDIAASITWASGGIVDGAPANATPADVINLSLAAETFCPTALQQAIEGARERGAVIIAAAGNANDDAAKYAPGNCNGVITVAATDRSGVRAPYSNFGERIDISAPGGNTATDGGILTTSNTGTTDTSEPTWAADQGTSYAAAHVTAAAAILKARDGTLTPDTIEQQLTGSIRPFASETCDSDPTRDCGPGILSLAQIAAAAGGDEDYAMTFDGTNQYATAPDNSAFEPTGALTFEAWLRPNTSCSSLQQFLRKELQFALGCQSGTWRYAFANGSWYNGGWIDTGVAVRTGSWQHFAVTRSDATSSILFYFDGQLAYTGAAANTLGNTSNALFVASGDGASTFFSGGLDELRIFNVARSKEDIQADMHTYGPTNTSGLLAYFDFNEGPAGTSGTGTVYNRASDAASSTDLSTRNGPTYTDVKETTPGTNTVVTFPRSYLTAADGWRPPAGVSFVRALLVGGGGGGGAWIGGGGGGGGVTEQPAVDVTMQGAVPVIVGAGGRGARYVANEDSSFRTSLPGDTTSFGSVTASGGGEGASWNKQTAGGGANGGGGGLGAGGNPAGGKSGGAGGSWGSPVLYAGGGGGGSEQAGGSFSVGGNSAGTGGLGLQSTLTNERYGGGGGGGTPDAGATAGRGGLGGGGDGGKASNGVNGAAGRGGGGGGGGGHSNTLTTSGGWGGSGVVIVSYTNTPGSPSVSSAIASAPTDVEVTWSAPSHTGTSDITGYTVTSSPGGLTCSTSAVAPNAPDTSCTVSGLIPGTAYTFTVVATNADGDGPASSASSAVVPFGELAKFSVTSTIDGNIGTKTAGESFNIKVVAQDSGDRTVANWTGTVEISSANTTISAGSGTTAAFSAGVLASHAVTVTTAGAGKTLTASNPSVGAGTGTSNGFTVDAGAASVATSTITAATSPVAINGGTSLITVQLKDQFGNELQTTGGTVALTSDLGSVGTVTDNGDGTYSATFTSGTVAGDATISGTLDSANIADTAAVVVNPGAASKLVVSPIGAQVAGVGFPVTVTLTDTFGNAVNNTGAIGSVALSRVSGTGTLGGSTSGSIGVGASSVTISGVTYSKAETGVSVLATGSGVGSLVASKTGTSGTFAVTAGAATQYSVTLSTSTPVAGSNVTVTAQLQDGDGNDVATAGKTVTWSKSILGGSFASATTLTDANGQATVVFTAPTVSGTSGAITATDNTTPTPLTGTSALLTTQVGPVDAAESTLAASASSVTADGSSTVTLTVQAKDQYGNNLTSGGATVVITQSSGSATLSGVTDNGNGTYTATVTSPITAGSSVFVATIDLSAVQGGTGSQQQVTVTYVAGAAAKLVITGSGSQVAGQSQTITITAQDAKGNTATTYTGSKTLRFGGANPSSNPVTVPTVGGIAFGSDTTVNFSSGQATANMVLFKAEAASISVTDPADSLTSSGAGNLAVTVSVNDPNKLVVSTQPVAAASGALFSTQPVVRILDAYGNQTNSAATVTMTVAGVGGVLGGSESTGKAASSGVVTFTNLTFAGRVGTTYKLEFDSGALTGADSDDFTPTGAGTAETIALNAGDGETATAGSAVPTPPSVQVTDSAGNPVSGIAVAFTVTGGGGSRAPTSAVNTNASGIAALTSWTLGTTAGANTLQASASGLTGSPVSFTATGTPGSADSLRSSQTLSGAASGAAFTTQPWISIVDANDNVVTTDNGTVVTASVSAGGTLVGTSTASTVNGVAKFANLGLTGTSGTQYTVTFSASGVNSVDQSVTVTTGAAFKLVVTTSASGATYDNVWTTQPVVQIQDTGGNLVTTDSATDVTVAIAGQTLTGTTTVQALNGVATFSGLSLTAAPDTYTLTFTSSPALTGTSSALVLTQAAQTISFGGLGAKTFGDAPFSVAATASPSGLTVTFASQTGTVCSVSGTTVTILAAGTCTIRASQDGNTNYIAAPTVDQSFTVNQATPTFTWANTVVDYGTGPYPIAAPVSSTPGTFAYSSSDTSVISIIGSQITVAGAGTAVITATFTPTDGSNYSSGGTVTSSITVNAVELTVTASSPTVTYGDTIPTVTASIAGFVNGENSSVITTQPTCTTTYTQTANAGTSPSTSCSGAVAANYTFQYVSGAVTINKATPTLGSWSNVSKTYGDAAFALAAPSVTGVTGSVLPGTFDYGSGSTAVATVSGDTVTIAGVGSSVFTATFTPADTTNYTSTSTTMTLSVSAGTITVTASSPSVLFGAAVPTITATMTGFAYGQTDAVLTTQPVCSTAYTTTSPAGSTPSTSCSGAVAVNYTFVYVPGSVTIGQATPSLGAWANVSTTYGDPLFTLVDPAATGVTGASLAGSWDFSSGTTGVATVSGNTVSIAGAGSSVFTATFTPTDSTNYTTASTTMTLTVATTVLTVTASSASVIFGASVPSITPSYSGFVYGQGAGDLGTAPTCTTTYTDTSPVGPYPTICSGGVSNNYAFDYVAGTVAVSQATPTLSWSDVTKTYGDAPFAVTAPTATGVGGAAVTGSYIYTSSDTSVATVSGGAVTIVGTGSTTLTATFTPASGNYASGQTVTSTLTVNRASQAALSITSPDRLIFGQTLTLAASGGSGTGAVTFSAVDGTATGCSATSTLGYSSTGTCMVTANKASDTNYVAATPATQTVTIDKAGQTLAFTSTVPASPLPNGRYSPTVSSVSAVTGTSTGITPTLAAAGACSLAGGEVTFTVTGTCTITATAVGPYANYLAAAPVTQVIAVGSLNQNIDFVQPANRPFGSAGFALGATASSGLTVEYSLGAGTTNSACSVTPLGTVTILAVGTCEVVASQPGDAQYAAASNVTRAFQILPALATAPTLTSASASSQAITVGFTAPGFTGGVAITAYRLVATGGGSTVTTTACTSSPCTISGLENGTSYTVTVAAINSAGTGPASGASTALTPATAAFAVRNLSAAPDNTVVDVDWDQPADLGGGTFTRYDLSYRVAGTGAYGTPIQINPSVAGDITTAPTSYRVTGLANGTSYDFKVVTITSTESAEFTGNTAEVVQYPSTVPSAPRFVTVLPDTATDVVVSWSAPLSDGGSALTSPNYTVTVTSSTPGAASVTCVPVSTNTYCSALALSNDAIYTFTVVANNRMGASVAESVDYSVPSSNALLSNLTISSGSLTPAFDSNTFTYSVAAANAVSSITLTPTTDSGSATVTVDGVAVTSGTASQAIALTVGSNVIDVVVTASDPRYTQTYTVTVTRAAAPPVPSGGGGGGMSPSVPVTPPSGVMNGTAIAGVLVNGAEESDVLWRRNATNSGWSASSPEFSLTIATELPDGAPESLAPNGEMRVPQGGRIVVAGSGYEPGTELVTFAIPRDGLSVSGARAPRSMAGVVHIGSAVVNASGGIDVTFTVAQSMDIGQYVLQINGASSSNQVRSVNALLRVIPAEPEMRAGSVREAAFYKGRTAKLSKSGREKLAAIVDGVPKGAKNVRVSVVGVAVSQGTPKENLELARARAEVLVDQLVASGVKGDYSVSVSTNFQVRTVDKPTLLGVGMNAPAVSSAGKPLTTVTIAYDIGPP